MLSSATETESELNDLKSINSGSDLENLKLIKKLSEADKKLSSENSDQNTD